MQIWSQPIRARQVEPSQHSRQPSAFCIYPLGLCTNQPALHRTFHLNLLVLPPLAQLFVALSPLSVTGRQAVLATLVSHVLVAGLHRRCAAAAYRAPSSALRCQPSGLWLVLSLLFLLSALFLLCVLDVVNPLGRCCLPGWIDQF